MEKISLQMYTLRESMKTPEALESTLARTAQMGYQSVQITPPAFTDAAGLAGLLCKYGLTADSAICSAYQIPSSIDRIVRDAEALQTNTVRTDSINNTERRTKEGYQSFAKHLNLCGRLLKEQGLDFMYHFHSFEFISFGDTRGIDILLDGTDPEYVLFQPDVFWMTAAGTEPSRFLEKFRGRARYMHCKDYIILPSRDAVLETITHASAPVGTGNLCWEEIFRTARDIGIENFVAEDDMGMLDPFESAQISFNNLTAMQSR